jgi:hypothetical protein
MSWWERWPAAGGQAAALSNGHESQDVDRLASTRARRAAAARDVRSAGRSGRWRDDNSRNKAQNVSGDSSAKYVTVIVKHSKGIPPVPRLREVRRSCHSATHDSRVIAVVTVPRSAPQKTTSLPYSRTPDASSSGASRAPPHRALPTPPMKKSKPVPVLPEHSRVKSTSCRGPR